MKLSLVVAMAEDRVIGRDGDLPWRLPDDLKQFRRHTLGKAVIMGRKTWESLPNGVLKKRLNVVLSRQPDFLAEGAIVATSLDEALTLAANQELAGKLVEEAVVIGGASLYAEVLPKVERMVVTHVEAQVEGDTHFPEVDWDAWRIVDELEHARDERHAHAFRIVVYERA